MSVSVREDIAMILSLLSEAIWRIHAPLIRVALQESGCAWVGYIITRWWWIISSLSMAHQHSSSQPIRCSTRQKSSKKNADPLYPEMPGQWQDFNFPDEEFLKPAIAKQGVAKAEKFHCRPYSSFHHMRFRTGNPPKWGLKPKAGTGTQSFATSLSWWQRICEFQHAT